MKGEFRRTYLIRAIEADLALNYPKFLREHYCHNHESTAEIADRLGVSQSTVAKHLRWLGYSLRQSAYRAWQEGLLPELPYESLREARRTA